jgi:hypothetical protein
MTVLQTPLFAPLFDFGCSVQSVFQVHSFFDVAADHGTNVHQPSAGLVGRRAA